VAKYPDRRSPASSSVSKILGKEPGASTPLEELVTPESLALWNLEEVAEIFRDHAPTTMVRYLAPDWAMIFLGRHSGEPILITEPTLMEGYGLFLRYEEESRQWLIHMIGDANTPVEELP
jgi:hypothetical protein